MVTKREGERVHLNCVGEWLRGREIEIENKYALNKFAWHIIVFGSFVHFFFFCAHGDSPNRLLLLLWMLTWPNLLLFFYRPNGEMCFSGRVMKIEYLCLVSCDDQKRNKQQWQQSHISDLQVQCRRLGRSRGERENKKLIQTWSVSRCYRCVVIKCLWAAQERPFWLIPGVGVVCGLLS